MNTSLSVFLALLTLPTAASWAATFSVTSTNDSGAGSLRQALVDADTSPRPHLIQFNLPGNGVHTLAPLTPLPDLTNTVTIDGYSQPGAKPNSLHWGSDALLLVRLDGIKITNSFAPALMVRSSGSVVRGLIIVRFAYGIQINAGSGNVIAGNWIGLDFDGIARGMTFDGVTVTCPVFASAMHNMIGGETYEARNVISGNRTGISFSPTTAANNFVLGNFIGTDAAGALPRGNLFAGVSIQSATNILISGNVLSGATGSGGCGIQIVGGATDTIQGNLIGHGVAGQDLGNVGDGIYAQSATGLLIGGVDAVAENRIGFNGGHGIELLSCTGATIQGNNIGTGSSGAEPWGNLKSGIYLNNSRTNYIGGINGHNTIVYNGGAGVNVYSGTGNQISANYIYDNGGLSIDLGDDGPTPNDPGDSDTGANQLQNYPVLTAATVSGSVVVIQGTLNSQANTKFSLEFFASLPWDPFGNPEGQVFLGSTNVTTDAGGNVTVLFTASGLGWLAGDSYVITATATDLAGNTSELSGAAALTVLSPPSVSLDITRTGNTLTVAWPSSATGFQLESAASFAPPVQWQTITNGITSNGTVMSFVVPSSPGATGQFFRLHQQ